MQALLQEAKQHNIELQEKNAARRRREDEFAKLVGQANKVSENMVFMKPYIFQPIFPFSLSLLSRMLDASEIGTRNGCRS